MLRFLTRRPCARDVAVLHATKATLIKLAQMPRECGLSAPLSLKCHQPTPRPLPLPLSISVTHNLLAFLVLQEQLRRRREEEERIAQQNEFLRNSLRGSRKLKALQDTTAASVSASATPLGSSSAGGAGGAGGGAKAQQQTAAAMVLGVENEAYLPDEDVAPQVEHIDGEYAG